MRVKRGNCRVRGKIVTSIKLFIIMILTFCFLNGVYSQPIEAATKYILSFTGKVKVKALPDGYYGKNISITPTLIKDKQGIYTLTIYEGTIVELGVKQTKDLTIRQVSTRKSIYTSNYQSGFLGISFNDELGKASSYKETITLQLADYNVGSKHPGEKYGPKLTLKVVVKKLPEQISKYRDDIMAILNANGYQKDMSDLQKVVLIYDWITNNVVYDLTLEKHSIENALYDRTAVCEGYAYLFYEMCQIIGVDVRYFTGTAGLGGRHAWNAVKLDKQWYYVDTTWDARNEGTEYAKRWSTYHYFLKGAADFSADHRADGETSLNISEENYIYPDWIWKAYAKRRLEVERKEFNDYSAFLNTGFDSWSRATIKEYNEEYHENTVYEELTESDLQYYKEWYETEKAQYSVGFMEWIGFHSEEAYIDYECIKLRLASQPTNKEEESKAFEVFYEKYPEEIDTYEFEEE
jgi:hypothetical protein